MQVMQLVSVSISAFCVDLLNRLASVNVLGCSGTKSKTWAAGACNSTVDMPPDLFDGAHVNLTKWCTGFAVVKF